MRPRMIPAGIFGSIWAAPEYWSQQIGKQLSLHLGLDLHSFQRIRGATSFPEYNPVSGSDLVLEVSDMTKDNGLVQVSSSYSVDETLERLEAAFAEKSLEVFAVI